jgi:hypothetical protein
LEPTRIVAVFNLAVHLMESSAVLTPSIETLCWSLGFPSISVS